MSVWIKLDGDKLRLRIDEQNLKHYWLAEMIGVHKSTLKRWLSRQISKAHEERVERLVKILNVPLSQIT